MSIDRSLKTKGALSRHRNVLKRDERIKLLQDEEKWSETDSVLGLPKVVHRKSHAGRKAEAAAEAGQETGTEPPESEQKPSSKTG